MSAGDYHTLGEAANRWVTFQMVMAGVSLFLFVLIALFFFVPLFYRIAGPSFQF
jgi:hypothetical protein